jgi:hypothetical protein
VDRDDVKPSIRHIEKDYPILMQQILARATGQLGEYLVSEALRARGFETEFTTNDTQLDLNVTAPDGRAYMFEVKTGRTRSAWFVRKRPWRSNFWVFVHAPWVEGFIPPPDLIEFDVLTLDEVQTIWDDNQWNQNNPTDGDIRRHQIPLDARDAWHKIC